MDVEFLINIYDNEGDIVEKCICLELDNKTIIKFKDIKELINFKNQCDLIIKEIMDNNLTGE